MTEDDLQYLRNINTTPGPDAGRRIDPTKPGPEWDAHLAGIYDRAWDAVAHSPELAFARKKLSIHELRTLIKLVTEAVGSAEVDEVRKAIADMGRQVLEARNAL